jgi:hypothetical protein
MTIGEIVLERRKVRRLPVRVPVLCNAFESDTPTHTLNLTEGGAYLETRENPPLGAPLELSLCLPDGEAPLVLAGRIVRRGCDTHEPAGVGVEFMAVDRIAHERLSYFVGAERATARW